ncbi:cupin domain-containing protein [Streptomyces sp. NPDC006638]|uniref:cupin domain-containing protein n=1 Tax=unclassified Streptomyces TaxID=2593676 RepID=UPI0033B9377B
MRAWSRRRAAGNGRLGRRFRAVGSGRAALVTASVAALAVVPSAALATPGSGVTGTILAQGTSDGTLEVKAEGRTDVVVRTITVAPGGSTGWHYHRGQLIVVVQSGTLTRILDDCSVEVTPAGKSFVEPSGSLHRHIGRNLGSEPVVLYLTYLLPVGSALSEDADPPHCAHG